MIPSEDFTDMILVCEDTDDHDENGYKGGQLSVPIKFCTSGLMPWVVPVDTLGVKNMRESNFNYENG